MSIIGRVHVTIERRDRRERGVREIFSRVRIKLKRESLRNASK